MDPINSPYGEIPFDRERVARITYTSTKALLGVLCVSAAILIALVAVDARAYGCLVLSAAVFAPFPAWIVRGRRWCEARAMRRRYEIDEDSVNIVSGSRPPSETIIPLDKITSMTVRQDGPWPSSGRPALGVFPFQAKPPTWSLPTGRASWLRVSAL